MRENWATGRLIQVVQGQWRSIEMMNVLLFRSDDIGGLVGCF
jgi:hypothetical protein